MTIAVLKTGTSNWNLDAVWQRSVHLKMPFLKYHFYIYQGNSEGLNSSTEPHSQLLSQNTCTNSHRKLLLKCTVVWERKRERERARYGPTLTSGPHGLGFRAQNNLRLMFIYKHTPRRTRLRDLCPPPPPLPFSLSLSLFSFFFSLILLSHHVPFSSSSSKLLCGSSGQTFFPVVFNFLFLIIKFLLPSFVFCHFHFHFDTLSLPLILLGVSTHLSLSSAIIKQIKHAHSQLLLLFNM